MSSVVSGMSTNMTMTATTGRDCHSQQRQSHQHHHRCLSIPVKSSSSTDIDNDDDSDNYYHHYSPTILERASSSDNDDSEDDQVAHSGGQVPPANSPCEIVSPLPSANSFSHNRQTRNCISSNSSLAGVRVKRNNSNPTLD